MLTLDALWLSSTMKSIYKKHIGYLMGTSPVYLAALVFYLLYAFGITVFVIIPGIRDQKSLHQIALYGALFGLVAYGTYDLTNHATVRDWPAFLTIVDMMWGACVTGVTSGISVYILRLIGVA